jgi:hypothetical protein
MNGVADDGSLIYYDERQEPPTDDMIGSLCVVALADGRVLVKKLFRGRGPGLYDLESTNAPTMRDERVTWAAFVTAIVPRIPAQRMIRRGAA